MMIFIILDLFKIVFDILKIIVKLCCIGIRNSPHLDVIHSFKAMSIPQSHSWCLDSFCALQQFLAPNPHTHKKKQCFAVHSQNRSSSDPNPSTGSPSTDCSQLLAYADTLRLNQSSMRNLRTMRKRSRNSVSLPSTGGTLMDHSNHYT